MPETVVVHPVGFTILNTYLRARTEVTALVSTRIGRVMPGKDATPRFPAIRITELTSVEVVPRVWMRMYVQFDCWAATQLQADQLARTVVAVLRASGNFTTDDAVLGETQDLAVRSAPDESIEPSQPRSIVTGHVWIRPN